MYGTIYKAIWVVYGMLAAILWISGRLEGLSQVILGMTAFGLIYFGMMLVLPLSISHPKMSENKGTGMLDRFMSTPGRFLSFIERRWRALVPSDPSMTKARFAGHNDQSTPARS